MADGTEGNISPILLVGEQQQSFLFHRESTPNLVSAPVLVEKVLCNKGLR